MTKTYVIADLHGRYDLLKAAISHIEHQSPGGTIVFTGDYVDRGPQSRQIIETLMAGPSDPTRWTWVCLRGNHEEIMIAGCMGMMHWWLPNGGGATLVSYGAKQGDDAKSALEFVPQEHLRWISGLPVIHNDGKRLFVHAGVQGYRSLEDQDEHENTWMLYPGGAEDGYVFGGHDLHVVHGHHQHEDGPILLKGRSNFDTLAWYTGRLVVGVFDDDVAGAPVGTIEIKGPSAHEMKEAA